MNGSSFDHLSGTDGNNARSYTDNIPLPLRGSGFFSQLGKDILETLGRPGDLHHKIKQVIGLIKTSTGLEAVGMRLRSGNDFPYFYQEGFSEEFIVKENSLLARDNEGMIIGTNCTRLECTCGLVLTGGADPSNPLFTRGGSAWTNDSFPFLEVPVEDDPRYHPRNQCIHEGYGSISLVPVKAGGRIEGLLQMNDSRKDCFSLEVIEWFENIALGIGEAVFRSRAEEKLKIKDKAVDASLNAIAIAGLDGTIGYVNLAFLHMWGFNEEKMVLDQNFTEFWEDREKASAVIFALDARGSWTGEMKGRKQDGQLMDVNISIAVVHGDDGSSLCMVGSFIDITKRLQAEHMMRERMKELQSFYKLAELSTRKGITLPVLFREMADFLPGSMQYPEITFAWIQVNDNNLRTANYRQTPWMVSSVIKVRGEIAGSVGVGYLEDRNNKGEELFLQEERMMIDTLAVRLGNIVDHYKAETALKETSDKYSQLLQTTDQGIYGIDLNGLCTFINRSALKILGYQEEECIELNMHKLVHLKYPDGTDYPVEKCPIYQAMLSGKGSNVSNEVFWKKDGSSIPVEYSSYPIMESGGISGLVVTFSDITSRKKDEAELLRAKEKAEESDRLKSTFLANMSHEIRTPLNAIVGFSGFFADPDLGLEERKLFAGIIASRSEDLLNLINDILDISRIESGNATVVKEKVCLNDILDEIEIDYMFRLQKMNRQSLELQLVKELPAEQSVFTSDRHIIRQVYSNLINNAIKYTETGFIRIGYRKPERGILTGYVSDTGIGIDLEEQDLIFQHFRQASRPETKKLYGGTGLGLAICKGALEMIGGKIWVESTPGKGSTFYFTLPFEEEPDSRPKTEPAVSQANAEHGDWSGKKILIVEDEESNMELLRFLLRPFHPELILAYNGEEALSRFEQTSQIDVVLLDIRLPDISGWEIAKKMKNIRPSVPVIAQTAYAMSSDQKKSRDTGCEGYITKPISKEKLYKTLSEFLSS